MPFQWEAFNITGSADEDLLLGYDGVTTTIAGNGGDDLVLGDVPSLVDWTANNSGIGSARTLEGFGWNTYENQTFANAAIPHISILNTTTAGQAEYYYVALTAGQVITVDIDFGGDVNFI